MQVRNPRLEAIKHAILSGAKFMGPPLTVAAVATNAYILLAPEGYTTKHDCRSALQHYKNPDFLQKLNATLIEDIGIYTFMIAGTVRGVLIPVGHWAYSQVTALLENPPQASKETKKSFKIAKDETLKTVSSVISLLNLPLPYYIKALLMPIAAVPTFRFIAYKKLIAYPGSASHAHYKETYGEGKLANILTSIESVSSASNLGFAAATLGGLGFNLFVDSVRSADPVYQNPVIYSAAMIAAVLGALSVFNESLQLVLNDASLSIQMTNIIAMPIIAGIICMEPSLLNTDTFYTHSLPIFLAILVASGGIAEVYRRSVAYKPENEGQISINEISDDEEAPALLDASSRFSEDTDKNAYSHHHYGTFYSHHSNSDIESNHVPANSQRRKSI